MNDSPRLLTRRQAARYCGLSSSGFAKWVSAGRLPHALPGTRRWDRNAIDSALDRIMTLQAAEAHKGAGAFLARRQRNEKTTESKEEEISERWLQHGLQELDAFDSKSSDSKSGTARYIEQFTTYLINLDPRRLLHLSDRKSET